ncbi:MAG: hypothetical protein IID41_12960 [Planctomycetes bacterium]|nr:hypothetical protein [Planctomycetota bacterium]MCH8965510.1 hypothetical protein [Planctomycetota bacterium]
MEQTSLSQWLVKFMEWAGQTVELMVPRDLMPGATMTGMALLAAGLFCGIYGAHYARGILSAILGGIGFAIGVIAARAFGIAPVLGGLAGLLALASLGYYTHRMWVGVAVGMLASSIGLFVYGQDSVSAFLEYKGEPVIASAGEPEYALPSAEEQESLLNPRLLAYLDGLYRHLREVQPRLTQNTAVLSTLFMIGGFAVGVLLTRWALILSCAVIGTVLFNLSLVTFADAFAPGGWAERLSLHPNATLAFISTCLVLSMLIQFRMTQQSSSASTVEKPKS